MRACPGIDTHGCRRPGLPRPGVRRVPDLHPPALLLVALVWLLPAACGNPADDRRDVTSAPPAGAVAAGTAEATGTGLDILAQGGNAADAAVAISLALAVTEPARSGLGGGITLLLRLPGEEPEVLYAPAVPLANQPSDGTGGSGGAAASGPVPLAPALLPVLASLHQDHGSGRFTWSELAQPAIRLAVEGHPLGRLTHRTIVQEYARLLADSGAAALVLAGNHGIPAEGTTVRNPALASTLQVVAREGPGALYGGDLGRRLLRDLRNRGVPVQEDALRSSTEPRRAEPLRGSFRGLTIWVPPEPFGGPRLLRGLDLLNAAPPEVWRAGDPFLVPWLAEAVAWSVSVEVLEDAASFQEEVPPLPIPPVRTGDRQGDAGEPGEAQPGSGSGTDLPPGLAAPPDPASGAVGETTHFSVADDQGMIVSATQSLGRPFGSGVPAGDLGFFLGDARGQEVEPPPGRRPGAVGRAVPADSAEGPGRAEIARSGGEGEGHVLSWATPTLVQGEDRLLALGSPGGPRGISAVLQVVARWSDAPTELPRIVRARRLHVGPGLRERGRVYLEGFVSDPTSRTMTVAPAPWTDSLRATLAGRGFLPSERDIGLLFDGLSPWFGGVNAVVRLDGEWSAVADPRRDGHAGVPGGRAMPVLTPPGGAEEPRPPAPGG